MTRNWRSPSDAELDRQIAAARPHSRIAGADEPRAAAARFDRTTGRLEIELADGCLFAIPTRLIQGLRDAAPALIARVSVEGNGYALRWDELDVDYGVAGLLAGRLGSRVWMREHARKAGSVTSVAKARASRRNGKKGGRPRKARER
jgi:hypothetical protein